MWSLSLFLQWPVFSFRNCIFIGHFLIIDWLHSGNINFQLEILQRRPCSYFSSYLVVFWWISTAFLLILVGFGKRYFTPHFICLTQNWNQMMDRL
jgi:hypothetical protein